MKFYQSTSPDFDKTTLFSELDSVKEQFPNFNIIEIDSNESDSEYPITYTISDLLLCDLASYSAFDLLRLEKDSIYSVVEQNLDICDIGNMELKFVTLDVESDDLGLTKNLGLIAIVNEITID